jgi:hypothetical protein
VSSLLYEVEIELHVANLVTAELIEVSVLASEHVSFLPRTIIFRIFETTPLDVEFGRHLALDADEIFQMEFLADPVVPADFPRVPELDEFVLAPEYAFEGINENDIRIVVSVEKLAFVGCCIELIYVSFKFLLRHLHRTFSSSIKMNFALIACTIDNCFVSKATIVLL